MSTIFFFWLLCGIAASYVATQKNKSGRTWFFLGMFLGPFALFMVAFSRANTTPALKIPSEPTRPCPYCAEEIKPEAVVCKHCGKDVPQKTIPIPSQIRKDYDAIQLYWNGGLNRDGIELELEKRGHSSNQIAMFLNSL